MRVSVTGSTGFIGSRLVDALRADAHDVFRVLRPGSRAADGELIRWDPAAGTIEGSKLEGIDAVVHLAGEGIADKRWSEDQKRRILESRTAGTTLLAETLAGLSRPPAVLLSASGMDYYGDRGDEILTEASAPGTGFLAEVCLAWEGATRAAIDAGIRTAFLRTTMVLDRRGGALGRMLPLFKLGVGGRIGSGRQWWSWVSIDDWIGAARFLLDHDVDGGVNVAGPEPVTNAEFTKALGAVVRRPTVLPVPAFGPKLLLGAELAHDLLLTSHRLHPAALEAAGYPFRHRDVTTALRAVLGGTPGS
jgi:uncharacterized protein (TIGR01777 family)